MTNPKSTTGQVAFTAADAAVWTRRNILAGTLAVSLWTATGCSLVDSITAPAAQPTPGPTDPAIAVVVVGAHANTPAPTLTAGEEEILTRVMSVNGQVAVIGVAGVPSIVSGQQL